LFLKIVFHSSKRSICELPDEVLVKIFSYLEPIEVLELTEICSRFNDVVSSQMMRMFKVCWTTRNKEPADADFSVLLGSSRRYQTLECMSACRLSDDLRRFINEQSYSLNRISLMDFGLNVSEMGEMLGIIGPNLRSFALQYPRHMTLDVEEMNPIPFFNLDHLRIGLKKAPDSIWTILKDFFRLAKSIKVNSFLSHIM
jgi:hypothetical protein